MRISLSPGLANNGVIFCDMQTAVLERADLLEAYIKESHWGIKDKLSSFHKALWENGYFLFVPKGIIIEKPFQAHIIQKDGKKSILNRNLIIMDEESSATVEELFETEHSEKKETICFSATEAFVEEAASLKYLSTQNWGKNIYDLSYRRLNVSKNAQLKSLFIILGAQEGRSVITGDASQEGAQIEHDAIIVGCDKQRFKIIAEMEHHARQTQGLMRYKGILKDHSYTDLDGLIQVKPTGQESRSRLEEHTLLLSKKARCDALPALDIQTDKVQVSHSAAVTQADEDKLFYLMSRGLNEEDALSLIVQGFFENLLALITRKEWYEMNKRLIESKLLSSS